MMCLFTVRAFLFILALPLVVVAVVVFGCAGRACSASLAFLMGVSVLPAVRTLHGLGNIFSYLAV